MRRFRLVALASIKNTNVVENNASLEINKGNKHVYNEEQYKKNKRAKNCNDRTNTNGFVQNIQHQINTNTNFKRCWVK